mmetsp:Transcript_26505/g.63588  ORF Transcript_26505/g.63588 Transcript_26505/m.63588 type:complete len:106 (+) Transcript_26505:240-557(+)
MNFIVITYAFSQRFLPMLLVQMRGKDDKVYVLWHAVQLLAWKVYCVKFGRHLNLRYIPFRNKCLSSDDVALKASMTGRKEVSSQSGRESISLPNVMFASVFIRII